MLRKALLWALGMVLLTAACSGAGDAPARTIPEFSLPPPAPSDPIPEVTSPVAVGAPTGPVPEPVGRLVILDDVGNIVTINPDGSNPQAITDDSGESTFYFQPLWSPTSDLVAWGETSEAGSALGVSGPDGAGRQEVTMSSLPFYLYWAPDGEHIAVLHNGLTLGTLDFEIVTIADATSSVAGTGAPFYFSWSPGGGGVAVHVGADQFSIVGTDGETTGLGSTSGSYLSPQWTSAGIFYLDVDGLRLHDAVDSSQLVATVPGFVVFVANRQGTSMAIQSSTFVQPGTGVALQQVPEILPNAVMVLDLATGEVQRATTRESLGFFWSPNGERLLILEISLVRGYIDAFVWEDGETRFVSSYQPAPTFVRDVLPFFSQYAQSLQIWSPNSSAFAFAGAVGSEEGIWVQSLDGSEPKRVSGGIWVAWSHE